MGGQAGARSPWELYDWGTPLTLQEDPKPWSCSTPQHSPTQPAPPPPPVLPLLCSPQAALVRIIVMGQQPCQRAVDDDTGYSLPLAQLRVPPLTPCQLLWLLGLSRARRPDHGGRFWERNTVHSAGPCTDAPAWPLTRLGPPLTSEHRLRKNDRRLKVRGPLPAKCLVAGQLSASEVPLVQAHYRDD